MSCGGDATAPRVPTSLTFSTQSVTLDALGATQSITATVLDQDSVVIAHPALTWTSSVPTVASVSATGLTGLTTALANGVTTVTASIAALSATATVSVSQVAVAPQKVSGDLQNGAAGNALPQPITVKVADRLGHAIAGKAVSFAVTQGGGSTATPNATSAADGTASTAWTIGSNASVANQVTATVAGVIDIATFTATAVAGPGAVITFGGVQIVDQGATAPANAAVRDRFGNPIASGGVTMVSRNPAILSVTPSGTMTGVARGQTIIVATTSGGTPITDSVVAVVRTPGAPVLMSSLTSFALAHDTTLTVSVFVNFGVGATKAASALIAVTWDPAVLHYVSSAAGATVVPTINGANAVSGSLALAFADGSGFTGNVEVARITFQTGSTIGASGPLTLTASELTGNDFADLTPALVQVIQRVVIR